MTEHSSNDRKLYGLLAEFDAPGDLLQAAERVKQAGYRSWDTHAPFPIHGLDEAMGIRSTILPYLVFGMGTAGCVLAIGVQWWMNAHDYPLLISGKPLWSLPANIPVAFEVTVLFSALTAVFGMLALNGLPRLHHPVFQSDRFRRATTDRMFVIIEAKDPMFDEAATRRLLESLGPITVERIEDE
jgi:hypothetical protein